MTQRISGLQREYLYKEEETIALVLCVLHDQKGARSPFTARMQWGTSAA